jgi:hypothetical protein
MSKQKAREEMEKRVAYLTKLMGTPEKGAGSIILDGADYRYRIEIELESGGVTTTPFGPERYTAKEMIQMLDYAIKALEYKQKIG